MLQEKGHLELVVEEGGPQAPVISAVSPYATTSLITSQAFSPPPYSNSDSTSGGKASTCPYVQGGGQGSYECRSCSDCGSHATAEELEAILQGPVRLHAPPQGPQAGVQVAQAAVQQRAPWPSTGGQGTTTPPRHKVLNIGELIPPPPEYPPPIPGPSPMRSTTVGPMLQALLPQNGGESAQRKLRGGGRREAERGGGVVRNRLRIQDGDVVNT